MDNGGGCTMWNVLNVTELYTLKWHIFMVCIFYYNKKEKKEKLCQFRNKWYLMFSVQFSFTTQLIH